MNVFRKARSRFTETVQTGLPLWIGASDDALVLPDTVHEADRFFYRTFGDCPCLASIYDASGARLVDTLDATGAGPFPECLPDINGRDTGPDLIYADGQLFYLYSNMDRWPSAPASVHSLAVLIDRAWFEQHSGASLTPSEYQLVSLLLCGRDLRAAADIAGASYDTKRKQLRLVMEKFGVHAQTALVRSVTLDISAYVLDAIIRPEQRSPETVLAQEVYGRDIVIHSVSIGGADDVPIWEFGARRGHPMLFFHSMLAPIIFTPDMVRTLKALNLRVLMMPRHFYKTRDGQGAPQLQAMAALADVVDYLCDEPVICLGESAGCAWAAHFARHFPERVQELVFVATPQAGRPEALPVQLPRSATLFAEVSTKIRTDDRVISGMTRIYNSIARVPSLARRTLDFMLRQAPSDLATVDEAFAHLRLADWLRLIANTAVRASIDEVAHLQSNWVQDIFKLDLPMRFIHGDEDPLCPVEDAEEMVAALSGVPFTRVPNAGHLILGQHLEAILTSLMVDQKSNENVTPQSV